MRTPLIFSLLTVLSAGAASADDGHVLIITMDGFPAYLLNDPKAPIDTIRKLAAEGVSAEGMRTVNPSVTWPNHTTIATGVVPEKHGVIFNGLLVRNGSGKGVRVDPARDQSELVAVPTIWDVAHAAGLSTAAINWPCSRNSPAIDDNFPDVADPVTYTTPRLRDELVQAGILPSASEKDWKPLSGAQHDRRWTDAACYVITHRKPNLMLLHMLVMDSIHHQYGPQTTAGYGAASIVDLQLAQVLRALDAAGIRDKTTIFLVADHGFAVAKKIVQPNVVLRKAGLLHASAAGVTGVQVQAVPEGGTAFIYFDAATASGLREKVIELFKAQDGVADVITPDRFASLGLPTSDKNPHMAELVLAAKDGYAFGTIAAGDEVVRDALIGVSTVGNHGYLNTNPKMNALFVAAGRGIRKGQTIGVIDNTSVAPSAASLLGLKMPEPSGKVLREILTEQ